jgi:opacity protein-like surface antigen
VRRVLIAVVVLAALTAAASAVAVQRSSGAVFSRTSDSSVQSTADHIHSWLHAYSQSTDPDGLGAYAVRRNSSPSVPTATGTDESIGVHLGGYTGTTTVNRVITIKTPTTFPDTAVTGVTVTASLVADATTGKQPINAIGFAAIGSTGRTNPVTLARGVKDQMNLRIRVTGLTLNTLYRPTVKITVTFIGFTTSYYVYSIPVKVYYGNGAGPD